MSVQQKFKWPPLESNPEIFQEYMHQLGLNEQFQFLELYGFDEEMLMMYPQPILAVILAFESIKQKQEDKLESSDICNFFMKQTKELDNACGVIACLHSIYNNLNDYNNLVKQNSVLDQYYLQCLDKSSEGKAAFLEQQTAFQQIHEEYAQQGQSGQCNDQNEVKYHFVSFVQTNNQKIIELDGCKNGPIIIQNNEAKDLLRAVVQEIQNRISNQEISENLSVMILVNSQ